MNEANFSFLSVMDESLDSATTTAMMMAMTTITCCLLLVKFKVVYSLADWYRRRSLSGLDVVKNSDLRGKFAIVTGACRSIGFETAAALASCGCHVVMACQHLTDAEQAAERIRKRYPAAKCVPMQLDLLRFDSVRKFAEAYLSHDWKLHYLVLNAGAWHWKYETSADGWNGVMQINYLSHWYLTDLLIQRLVASAPSRVLVVSSWSVMLHHYSGCNAYTRFDEDFLRLSKETFSPTCAYSCSKVCNTLFAKTLNKKFRSKGVTAYSIHPGWVRTEIWSHLGFCGFIFKFFTYVVFVLSKNPAGGASTTLHCAVTRKLEELGGRHFEDCQEKRLLDWFDSEDLQKQLWNLTKKVLYVAPSETTVLDNETLPCESRKQNTFHP